MPFIQEESKGTKETSQEHLLDAIHDSADGAEPVVGAPSPVPEVPVLSWPHVHHPASTVGVLVHQPVTVHHIAGHEVRHVEAVHGVGAVVHQLHHLAAKVHAVVQPHPKRATVLQGEWQVSV